MPKNGEYYERYIVDGSFWRHEVRKIIDVSPFGVLYLEILEPTKGTTTDQGWDADYPQLVTMPEWDQWAKLARLKI